MTGKGLVPSRWQHNPSGGPFLVASDTSVEEAIENEHHLAHAGTLTTTNLRL